MRGGSCNSDYNSLEFGMIIRSVSADPVLTKHQLPRIPARRLPQIDDVGVEIYLELGGFTLNVCEVGLEITAHDRALREEGGIRWPWEV